MTIPDNILISTTDQHCKLLELPAELRTRIYTLALVEDDAFEITERHHSNVDRLEPALLATCRQVRDEVLSIFYSGNTFAAADNDSRLIHSWLKQLLPAKLKLLKQVRRTIVDDRRCWDDEEWPEEAKQYIHRVAGGYGFDKRTHLFLMHPRVLLQPVQLVGSEETLWVSYERLGEFGPVHNGRFGLQYVRRDTNGA